MRGLPWEVRSALTKARESALLAVETYNRPGTGFRSGGYIILMVVAWTALFHAFFIKKGIKPFYIKVKIGRYIRYEKIDGENKAWELAECVGQFYKDQNTPARMNLEFFTGLRNKIEHRSIPQLDDQIFGECQALLLNFEGLLISEFGEAYSLNESLAVSLQFSSITPAAKISALRRLQIKAYPSITDYVQRFRSSLSSDVFDSMEYSYRVFLFPKTGNHLKTSDIAVEFINTRALDEISMKEYEKIVTLLKTRESSVVNPGSMKPSDVRKKVEERLGQRFTVNDHTKCWRHFSVRPPTKTDDLTRCNTKYCQYDMPHKDYIYTNDWADFLISKLSNPDTYKEILGRQPDIISETTA